MKEIIILGTGNSMPLCPYDCETWGVNGAYMAENYPFARDKFRIDKLFLTDYLFRPTGQMNFDIERMNSLIERYNCQIITLRKINLGKFRLKASPFPYRRAIDKLGSNYFTSTICYMLAYALYKNTYLARNQYGVVRLELNKPLTLKLYGVDMVTTVEYYTQKAGVEFWVGYARALGCTVDISRGSAIMAFPTGGPYGFKIKYNLKQVDPYNLLKKETANDK